MRIGKVEFSLAVLLSTLALGIALQVISFGAWQSVVATTIRQEDADLVPAFFVGGMGCLVLALCGGLFWTLPAVRRQSRERGRLQSLAGALSERSRDLEKAALTDALTGMSNRRYFDEALAQYFLEFSRLGKPLGLLVVDIDHFKLVNDTHGHDVGDEVLKAVSACLYEFTRYHDIVARLGGEEFAIVAPNMRPAELRSLADRIRKAVSRLALDIGNVRLRVTVSVGLASSQVGDQPAALLKRADVALYQAKSAGRNRVCA